MTVGEVSACAIPASSEAKSTADGRCTSDIATLSTTVRPTTRASAARGERSPVIATRLGCGSVAPGYHPSVSETDIDLGRPADGDVVDLILADHRRFEALLRDLRDSSSDRDAVRRALAALHT